MNLQIQLINVCHRKINMIENLLSQPFTHIPIFPQIFIIGAADTTHFPCYCQGKKQKKSKKLCPTKQMKNADHVESYHPAKDIAHQALIINT